MLINWDYRERISEILAVITNSLFSVIVIVVVLVICIRKTKRLCIFVRFSGHMLTWILALATIMVLMFEVLEGILLDVKLSSFQPFLHASNITAIVAVIFLLILYHIAEGQCCSAYLLLILLYWSATAAISIAEIVLLNSGKDSAKQVLVGLMSGLSSLQVILNVFALAKQVRGAYCKCLAG